MQFELSVQKRNVNAIWKSNGSYDCIICETSDENVPFITRLVCSVNGTTEIFLFLLQFHHLSSLTWFIQLQNFSIFILVAKACATEFYAWMKKSTMVCILYTQRYHIAQDWVVNKFLSNLTQQWNLSTAHKSQRTKRISLYHYSEIFVIFLKFLLEMMERV